MFRTPVRTLQMAVLLGVITVLCPALAQAETENCTEIAALPAVVTSPGIYCLKSHLVTSITTGPAITIASSNVVLDFNGFSISNTSAGIGTAASGVFFDGRKNITIRNGSIIGFMRGILVWANAGAAQGLLIEEMRISESRFAGILLSISSTAGSSAVVRDSQVNRTGGTTDPSFTNSYGIFLAGGAVTLINNDVKSVTPQGGQSYGIYSHIAVDHMIVNNRVSLATNGIASFFGKIRDNVTTSVMTAYVGGIDIGNNN